ncbi:hypothetical protein QJQ45_005700 [Haematococcus lacustris]|nr:hypothetical protein QJQ45_005700 [Haematococcus lacustris]
MGSVRHNLCVTAECHRRGIKGGTRFIGLYLARQLVEQGHDVTLFTRGKKQVTSQIPDDTPESFREFSSKINHIAGDRMDYDDLKRKVQREGFQSKSQQAELQAAAAEAIVYDINGREAIESEAVLAATRSTVEQFIYCSSAGVYLKSDMMPHREEDDTDVKSRHKPCGCVAVWPCGRVAVWLCGCEQGKLETEEMLSASGIPWTSVRPVYIYGPLNYNPVEEWFFHRIKAGRPIPVPGSGMQVTQLGHVKDLATAFVKCLGNTKAYDQIYNVSGERVVTFNGIAKACAKAAGAPEPEIINYNAKDFDFGKDKPFPLRDQHFFTSVDKAMADLNWKPEFSLLDGLKDSYDKDFGRGTFRKAADFKTDDMVLEKLGKKKKAVAYAW